jgi:transcriptional regulator with XRE-family HTH domain
MGTSEAGPYLLEVRLGEISDRIKQGRERHKLTLAQLGKRSKVAASSIQKIENRQMTPSIAVILKLAAGLGIEPADLIAPANPSRLNIVVERVGQHLRMGSDTDLMYEKLSADMADTQLECWRIYLPPRHDATLPTPVRLEEFVVICEKGRVELDFGRERYELKPGDTLHCKSAVMHGLRNLTAKPASYLNAGRFPHEMSA